MDSVAVVGSGKRNGVVSTTTGNPMVVMNGLELKIISNMITAGWQFFLKCIIFVESERKNEFSRTNISHII